MTRMTMKNPEYANSATRLEALHRLVIDGKDAEAVGKYADRLVDEIGKETLEAMLGNGDITEQRMLYKVAVRFSQMLKGAAIQGALKESSIESIRKE